MAKLSNIDAAYEYLKEKKDSAEFNEIWNSIASNINSDNENKGKLLANLYSDLVLDNRFSLTADGKWALRSNMSYEDIKKNYDYVSAFDLDQDFDDIEETVVEEDTENSTTDNQNTSLRGHEEDVDDNTTFVEIDEDEDDEHFVLEMDEDSYGDGDEK